MLSIALCPIENVSVSMVIPEVQYDNVVVNDYLVCVTAVAPLESQHNWFVILVIVDRWWHTKWQVRFTQHYWPIEIKLHIWQLFLLLEVYFHWSVMLHKTLCMTLLIIYFHIQNLFFSKLVWRSWKWWYLYYMW
jgi:hypothetical protein